jgi:hypothetical protein
MAITTSNSISVKAARCCFMIIIDGGKADPPPGE